MGELRPATDAEEMEMCPRERESRGGSEGGFTQASIHTIGIGIPSIGGYWEEGSAPGTNGNRMKNPRQNRNHASPTVVRFSRFSLVDSSSPAFQFLATRIRGSDQTAIRESLCNHGSRLTSFGGSYLILAGVTNLERGVYLIVQPEAR